MQGVNIIIMEIFILKYLKIIQLFFQFIVSWFNLVLGYFNETLLKRYPKNIKLCRLKYAINDNETVTNIYYEYYIYVLILSVFKLLNFVVFLLSY